jgi:hypothetical protein
LISIQKNSRPIKEDSRWLDQAAKPERLARKNFTVCASKQTVLREPSSPKGGCKSKLKLFRDKNESEMNSRFVWLLFPLPPVFWSY